MTGLEEKKNLSEQFMQLATALMFKIQRNETMLSYLLATRWRSLASKRSNQMCGQAFTIDL